MEGGPTIIHPPRPFNRLPGRAAGAAALDGVAQRAESDSVSDARSFPAGLTWPPPGRPGSHMGLFQVPDAEVRAIVDAVMARHEGRFTSEQPGDQDAARGVGADTLEVAAQRGWAAGAEAGAVIANVLEHLVGAVSADTVARSTLAAAWALGWRPPR